MYLTDCLYPTSVLKQKKLQPEQGLLGKHVSCLAHRYEVMRVHLFGAVNTEYHELCSPLDITNQTRWGWGLHNPHPLVCFTLT